MNRKHKWQNLIFLLVILSPVLYVTWSWFLDKDELPPLAPNYEETHKDDHKLLLNSFNNLQYEFTGQASWNQFMSKCHEYHQKEIVSFISLNDYGENYLDIADSQIEKMPFHIISPRQRTKVMELESYMIPEKNEDKNKKETFYAFVPRQYLRDIWEIDNPGLMRTVWKIMVQDKRCYALLEEYKEWP